MAANRSRDYNPPFARTVAVPRSENARLVGSLLLAGLFTVVLFVSLPFRQERIISTWTSAQAEARPVEASAPQTPPDAAPLATVAVPTAAPLTTVAVPCAVALTGPASAGKANAASRSAATAPRA